MSRRPCVFLCLLLTVSGSAAQQVFRATTDIVSVGVSVVEDGRAVTGLAAADFELTDNGARQTVEVTPVDGMPVDVTLILTAFPATRPEGHTRQMEAAFALRNLLRAEDRLRIVLVTDSIISGLGQRDAPLLSSDVTVLDAGISLTDGLAYAFLQPTPRERRHMIVALTDGCDSVNTLELDRLPSLASQSEAVLHALLWTSPAEGPAPCGGFATYPMSARAREWRASYRAMELAIEQTGGTLQRLSNASGALSSLLSAFRQSYVLRYTLRETPTPGWHQIRVRLTRRGSFAIRARAGYVVSARRGSTVAGPSEIRPPTRLSVDLKRPEPERVSLVVN